MKKIVYITGCLGFIGSYVTKTCLERGWYVKGVDKITYAANKNLLEEFLKHKNFLLYIVILTNSSFYMNVIML